MHGAHHARNAVVALEAAHSLRQRRTVLPIIVQHVPYTDESHITMDDGRPIKRLQRDMNKVYVPT